MIREPVPVYRYPYTFSPDAEDENQHVNNVEYVRLLQESAIAHTRQNGWTPEELHEKGWTWIVRTHFIEYLQPVRAGEEIAVDTWVVDFKRIRSKRRYRFVRLSDNAILARAETEWVFLDFRSGRPVPIPPEVLNAYTTLPEGPPPP